MRKIVYSKIPWRGSVTDLATDCANLLTKEEGQALITELQRFLVMPHLADKFQGKGSEEGEEESNTPAKPPKPSKEEFTIQRLRKQLKRTQGQVQRLTTEAGTRFMKSQAAMFFSMLVAERAAHEKTKLAVRDLTSELNDAKRKNGEVTLEALRRLVDQAQAAKKP